MNIVRVIVINNSKHKKYYVNNAHVQINVPNLCIAPFRSGNRRISSARREQVCTKETL